MPGLEILIEGCVGAFHHPGALNQATPTKQQATGTGIIITEVHLELTPKETP